MLIYQSTLYSYNSTENVWTLRKAKTSIDIYYNGELAFQLNFSDFGEKCEEAGGRNVHWLNLWYNATDLQYKSQYKSMRGTVMFSLKKIIHDIYRIPLPKP